MVSRGNGAGVWADLRVWLRPWRWISSTFETSRCGGSLPCGISGLRSRKKFNGNVGTSFSPTQRELSTGSLPQMVGQGERISTKENPTRRADSQRGGDGLRAFNMTFFVVGESDALDVYRASSVERSSTCVEGSFVPGRRPRAKWCSSDRPESWGPSGRRSFRRLRCSRRDGDLFSTLAA